MVRHSQKNTRFVKTYAQASGRRRVYVILAHEKSIPVEGVGRRLGLLPDQVLFPERQLGDCELVELGVLLSRRREHVEDAPLEGSSVGVLECLEGRRPLREADKGVSLVRSGPRRGQVYLPTSASLTPKPEEVYKRRVLWSDKHSIY